MIIKSYELKKFDYKKIKNFLFYGNNLAQINQIIDEKIKPYYLNKVFNYEESEILKNEKDFFDRILSHSFFDNEKLLIIYRTTDKLYDTAKEILKRGTDKFIEQHLSNIVWAFAKQDHNSPKLFISPIQRP